MFLSLLHDIVPSVILESFIKNPVKLIRLNGIDASDSDKLLAFTQAKLNWLLVILLLTNLLALILFKPIWLLLIYILVIFEKSTSLILLFVIPPANLAFVILLSGMLLTSNIKLIILLQSRLIILPELILLSAIFEPVRKLSTK